MAAGSTVGQARAETDQDAAEYSQHPAPSLARAEPVYPHLWKPSGKRTLFDSARRDVSTDGNTETNMNCQSTIGFTSANRHWPRHAPEQLN